MAKGKNAKAVRRATQKKPAAQKAQASKQDKIDTILKQQAEILKNEAAIKKDEEKIVKDETRIERLEEKEVRLEQKAITEEKREHAEVSQENAELAKLEALEKEVKKDVAPHPLTRLTVKDFMKGIVGAFIGVVVHFTFTYGVELAENITAARATALLVFSLIIGTIFLYFTGFRKVDKSVKWLLPYRIVVLYGTAIIITIVTLWFFYPNFAAEPGLAYRQVATVNLSAVIGACTADLIGRD